MYGLLVYALLASRATAQAPPDTEGLLNGVINGTRLNDVPSQCGPSCKAYWGVVQKCDKKDIKCGCTSDTANQLASCLQCILDAKPSSGGLIVAQKFYDASADRCLIAGSPVPDVTFTIPEGASAFAGAQGGGGGKSRSPKSSKKKTKSSSTPLLDSRQAMRVIAVSAVCMISLFWY